MFRSKKKTKPSVEIVAMRYLARREHSEAELIRKLEHKTFTQTEIASALQHMKSQGLQSDERFTEAYIHSRCAYQFGPLKIRQELLAKGIHPLCIADHLDPHDPVWAQLLSSLWQRKLAGQRPCDFKTYQKQLRFLQQRGFSLEMIHTFFKQLEFEEHK